MGSREDDAARTGEGGGGGDAGAPRRRGCAASRSPTEEGRGAAIDDQIGESDPEMGRMGRQLGAEAGELPGQGRDVEQGAARRGREAAVEGERGGGGLLPPKTGTLDPGRGSKEAPFFKAGAVHTSRLLPFPRLENRPARFGQAVGPNARSLSPNVTRGSATDPGRGERI